MTEPLPPRFLDSGDGGLTVELGSDIDPVVNGHVIALDRALAARAVPGVLETVPTYRSLLVLFDPVVLGRAALKWEIMELWPPPDPIGTEGALWRVPVLYGGASGIDLDSVAALHGLTPDELIAIHSGSAYRVYMVGFAPGFAYLGGLPDRIHTSRRTEPRMRTPPRSISIGGRQAAISPPLELPSGWHLLGQTPVRSYDPARRDRPFLFAAGDLVRFLPVTESRYRDLLEAAEAGALVAEREDLDE